MRIDCYEEGPGMTVFHSIMAYASAGGVRLASASRSCKRLMVVPLFNILENECARALMMLKREDVAGQEKLTLACGRTITRRSYDKHVAY